MKKNNTPPITRGKEADETKLTAERPTRVEAADEADEKDRKPILRYEQFSSFLSSFPSVGVRKFLNSFSDERILDVLRHIPDFPILMSQWSSQYFQSLNRAHIGQDLQRLEEVGVRKEALAIAMMVVKSAPFFDNEFALLGDKRERGRRARRLLTPLADLTDLAKMFHMLPGVILPGWVSQEIPNPRNVSSELKMLSLLLDLGEFIYDSLGANHLQEVSKFALASLVHKTSGRFLDRVVANLVGAALGHTRYDETGHRVWRINNYERLQQNVPIVSRFFVALNTIVSTSRTLS